MKSYAELRMLVKPTTWGSTWAARLEAQGRLLVLAGHTAARAPGLVGRLAVLDAVRLLTPRTDLGLPGIRPTLTHEDWDWIERRGVRLSVYPDMKAIPALKGLAARIVQDAPPTPGAWTVATDASSDDVASGFGLGWVADHISGHTLTGSGYLPALGDLTSGELHGILYGLRALPPGDWGGHAITVATDSRAAADQLVRDTARRYLPVITQIRAECLSRGAVLDVVWHPRCSTLPLTQADALARAARHSGDTLSVYR